MTAPGPRTTQPVSALSRLPTVLPSPVASPRVQSSYIPATGSFRYTDTLQFIPSTFKFPETTAEEYLRQSVGDILALLQDPPKTLTFLAYGNDTKNAITKIAHLLQQSVTQPQLPLIPMTPLGPRTTQPVESQE